MKRILRVICGLSVLLVSCREDEIADAEPGIDPAQRVYLRATVESTIAMSRAPFNRPTPNEKNPLKAAVWASTTPYKFQHIEGKDGSDGTGTVALHTTANFTNGEEQLLNAAVYPKPPASGEEKQSVYFVGLHPENEKQSEWMWSTNAEGTIAVKTFNGSEDVMFAPQESGVYGGNTQADLWPTFKFRHLLTWLRVSVISEGEKVSEAWGKIKSLKVRSGAGNTVTIDIGRECDPDRPDNPDRLEDYVTFSQVGDDATLNFYKTGTNDIFANENVEKTWYPIPYNKEEEVAYALCAPVTASKANTDGDPTNEYTLIIKTEKRTIPVEVPVDLMIDKTTWFEESTMNRQFHLHLTFKMGNHIIATGGVTDWATGGISNGVLRPE